MNPLIFLILFNLGLVKGDLLNKEIVRSEPLSSFKTIKKDKVTKLPPVRFSGQSTWSEK